MNRVTQEAEVVAVVGAQVDLRACATMGCGSCSLSGGCGQGILSRWFSRRSPLMRLSTQLLLQPGDRVLVAMDAGELNRAAVLQFVLPLLGLLLSALLAEWLGFTSALLLAASALAGLFSGLLLASRLAQKSCPELVQKLE
ncbi:MAG: SoxR reducing system RseC family protein [Marinospirillum sp.]|uniref:SoxR reducing system RseC family protein n=1 Tax=Marinospirillum sp. TaxID=2183934 RepID=UPI0019D8DECC|nr:SoxR reducing system RseC family protein [Marinospirillum sp.]MBE0506203.1 SoxR reducing system RseC family protein [Marinospirillum sp.]